MEPFKNVYNLAFYRQFISYLHPLLPHFDSTLFLEQIFDSQWENRELKDRMRHTTKVLHHFLPADFPGAATVVKQFIKACQRDGNKQQSIAYLFLPDYIETYGIDHFAEAMKTIELLTQFVSCEFAIRPFFVRYPQETIRQMLAWSTHSSEHVRRLASEGSRPRLPWGMALQAFKKDPLPLMPILENLKNDPSLYVRKSVANHLNDISKDNPQLVLDLLKKWSGGSKETDWIVKHACRTLLKAGHTEVLRHFNLECADFIHFSEFRIDTPQVKNGESLRFSFRLRNNCETPMKIRLEYGLYYLKANGGLSKKVFKISEKMYLPQEEVTVTRNQSFKPITTRTFYIGTHKLSVILNGEEQEVKEFELV